jgi:2-polyprenyl-3-methyl-5-hydroxy-6-metoxy-1,4-benzoquinol methylase
LSLGEKVRELKELFRRFGPRRPVDQDATDAATARADSPNVFRTRALQKFLASLGSRSSPVLLDVGRAVGPNVTFFGEQLGCMIYVEDLYADLDRHAVNGTLDAFPTFLTKRFNQPDGSVDGILCWDLFDHLDPAAAQALAAELKRLLKPDGLLFALFHASKPSQNGYVKYVIVDESHLLHRPYPASQTRLHIHLSRDIVRLFEGLVVSDSFLLQVSLREMLFRKPAGAQPRLAG